MLQKSGENTDDSLVDIKVNLLTLNGQLKNRKKKITQISSNLVTKTCLLLGGQTGNFLYNIKATF